MRPLLLLLLMLAALGSPLAGLVGGAGLGTGGCADGDGCCCSRAEAPATRCHGTRTDRCGTQLVAGCRCGQHPGDVAHHAPSDPLAYPARRAELPRPAADRPLAPRRGPALDALTPAPEPPPPRAAS